MRLREPWSVISDKIDEARVVAVQGLERAHPDGAVYRIVDCELGTLKLPQLTVHVSGVINKTPNHAVNV